MERVEKDGVNYKYWSASYLAIGSPSRGIADIINCRRIDNIEPASS